MGMIKTEQKITCGEDMEKLEPSWIAGGNLKCSEALESILAVLQNVKYMTQQLHS